MISQLNKNRVYIGIDFGLKKIGVAVGQPITNHANPITIINNDTEAYNQIDLIIQEWLPHAIIIGYPFAIKKNHVHKNLDIFIKNLEKNYANKIDIIPHSEILSTEEAKTKLRELRKSNIISKKKINVDDISACLILESWFNDNITR